MKKKMSRRTAIALVKVLLAKGDNQAAENIASQIRSQKVEGSKAKGMEATDIIEYIRSGISGIDKGLQELKLKAERLRPKVLKEDSTAKKKMKNLLINFQKNVVKQWV